MQRCLTSPGQDELGATFSSGSVEGVLGVSGVGRVGPGTLEDIVMRK